MSPIEEITKNVSKDCTSISLIIPLVRALTKELEQSDDDIGVRGMKRPMLLSLQRRFSNCSNAMQSCLDSGPSVTMIKYIKITSKKAIQYLSSDQVPVVAMDQPLYALAKKFN